MWPSKKHKEVHAGSLQERLQNEIASLSKIHGGPSFEPHVTLVGGFEAVDDKAAIRAGQQVADQLKVCKNSCTGKHERGQSLTSILKGSGNHKKTFVPASSGEKGSLFSTTSIIYSQQHYCL